MPIRWIFMGGALRESTTDWSLGHTFGGAGSELGGEALHFHGEPHGEVTVKPAVAIGLAAAGLPDHPGDDGRAAGVEAAALALGDGAVGPALDALAVAAPLLTHAVDGHHLGPPGALGAVLGDAQGR